MNFVKCRPLTDLTLTAIVKYSVGYSFGVFISLEIIPFTQTVKGTSRAENHPVWTSNCTGDLETICVAQLWLDTSLILTRLLNQAYPQYWLVYLLNGISWENEPESYLLAISLGQLIIEHYVWSTQCGKDGVGQHTRSSIVLPLSKGRKEIWKWWNKVTKSKNPKYS